MLTAFEYLLGITQVVEEMSEQRRLKQVEMQAKKQESLFDLKLEQGKDCFLCYESI